MTFTRVGAVYPESIKIVARYPQYNATDSETVRVIFRELKSKTPSETSAWKDGPLMTFQEKHDWVDTVKLGALWPNTSYECELNFFYLSICLSSNYILDAFATLNRTQVAYPGTPLHFRTFPDPRLPTGNHFRFVVSSCVTPNHPYSGPLHRNTIKGFDLLADYLFPPTTTQAPEVEIARDPLESSTSPDPSLDTTPVDASHSHNYSTPPPTEFLLFLGDFIYADVPLYFGDDKEAYRRLYRRNYQSPSYRKIYERLRKFYGTYNENDANQVPAVIHAYDDHEVSIDINLHHENPSRSRTSSLSIISEQTVTTPPLLILMQQMHSHSTIRTPTTTHPYPEATISTSNMATLRFS